MDNESSRMDLPMEECVEHVSTQSDKTARKVKEKYHQHLRTNAYPRFCVKHRSSTEKEAIIYLYVLHLKAKMKFFFAKANL